MKRPLQFLARLLGISLLLFLIAPWLHQSYRHVLLAMTTATLPAGATMGSPPFDGSDYLVVYFALILAVPGMKALKKGLGVLAGIALFLSADFFMTSVWLPYLQTARPSLTNLAVPFGWKVLVHQLFPCLLWFVFSFRQIEEICKPGSRANP